MQSRPVVATYGHMFSNLDLETAWKSAQAEIELRKSAAEEIVRILTGCAPRSQIKVPP